MDVSKGSKVTKIKKAKKPYPGATNVSVHGVKKFEYDFHDWQPSKAQPRSTSNRYYETHSIKATTENGHVVEVTFFVPGKLKWPTQRKREN